jgi:hypothetical protein
MFGELVSVRCACAVSAPVQITAWSTPQLDGEQVSVVEFTLVQCTGCKTIWVEQMSEDGVCL